MALPSCIAPLSEKALEIIDRYKDLEEALLPRFKQLQDPDLIASLSGHTDCSRAFPRYPQIDDEMKRKLVDMLD